MRVYFNNCLGSCANAEINLGDRTPVTKVLDHCVARWGRGRLVRDSNNDLVWLKDADEGDWRGCCQEKICRKIGIKPKPSES